MSSVVRPIIRPSTLILRETRGQFETFLTQNKTKGDN